MLFLFFSFLKLQVCHIVDGVEVRDYERKSAKKHHHNGVNINGSIDRGDAIKKTQPDVGMIHSVREESENATVVHRGSVCREQ